MTRGEFLDYALEIEDFDQHLSRMLKALEAAGELDNTLVVVTSDHGNPMPRSKCNLYDSGTHVPLAIRLQARFPAGRAIEDFIHHADLAPTLLDASGLKQPDSFRGRSFWDLLTSNKSGMVDKSRDFVVSAFERHIICRQDGVGYPMRSIRTRDFAYIRNYKPSRWPAGDPDFMSSHQGFYGDCDRGSSKQFILQYAHKKEIAPYYRLCFGRRPAEELYGMAEAPHQLHNLAGTEKFAETKSRLAKRLDAFLKNQADPRMRGETPWDTYPFSDKRIFKCPKWLSRGFPTGLPRQQP